jgi:hypothetical protein
VFYQPFGGTELGDGRPIALLLAPVAVALAYLLYRTVERPGGKWVSWRSALIAMAAMIGLASIAPAAQARRFDRYDQNLFKGFEDRASYRCGKLFRITHFGEALCILQPGERFDRRVLLAGDSHADAIKQSFAEAAAGKGIGVGFTVSNEPLLIHPLGPKWLIGQALGAGASRIYLHYYSAHLTPELIEEMADAAQQARIPLTIILPIPESAGSIPAQLYEARHQGREPPSIDRLAYERSIQPLLAAAGRHPDVELIEVAPWLCDASRCQVAADDGTSYYFDANHLTLTGAMRLEPLFASQLVRPPNNRIAAAAKSDKERR